MAVAGIDHVNIRTLDIAGTADFYSRILGLRYDGPREVDGFARNWLHDREGRAIIHLRELAPAGDETGAVDHVALRCEDMALVLGRLDVGGIAYALRENPTDRVAQVFLKDPNGIALELSFQIA